MSIFDNLFGSKKKSRQELSSAKKSTSTAPPSISDQAPGTPPVRSQLDDRNAIRVFDSYGRELQSVRQQGVAVCRDRPVYDRAGRRLVIAEADRFPEFGQALYDGGPGRAIAGLAVNLQRWADRDLLSISDAMVAATQFNWLVMGDPINQAMFRADYVLSRAQRVRHIEQAVRVFIAAYAQNSPIKPQSALHREPQS